MDGAVGKSHPLQGTAKKIEVITERTYENNAFRKVMASGSGVIYIVSGEARVFEAVINYAVSDGHNYLLEEFHQLKEGAPVWSAFSLKIEIPKDKLPVNGTLVLTRGCLLTVNKYLNQL